MGKVLQFILVALFLGAEIYSINLAFQTNSMEYYEGSFLGFIFGNLIVLAFAIMAPFYFLMWPIIILIGAIMPIAGLVMIWSRVFGKDDDSSILIGIGLCVGGYYYTTKVSLSVTTDVFLPGITNFLNSLLSFIN